MDPKAEKNANLPQLPEQCAGAGAGRAPAKNAAEQPSGDDGLTRSEMAANRACVGQCSRTRPSCAGLGR